MSLLLMVGHMRKLSSSELHLKKKLFKLEVCTCEADKKRPVDTTRCLENLTLLGEQLENAAQEGFDASANKVPKVEKIVVNCGIGDAAQNSKGLDVAINDMALITGQRPVNTKAKNAIATFKSEKTKRLESPSP